MSFETWWYGEHRAVLRRIGREPSRRIADVTDGGRAMISGTVEPLGDLVTGPLSDLRCVYWRIEIEEVGASDSRVCGRDEAGVEFLVRDPSGVARVIPERARMALAVATTNRWLSTPRAFEVYQRIKARPNYASSMIRVREYLIVPASVIQLAGTPTRETDPNPSDAPPDGYRGQLPSRPVFAHTRRAPLAIADGHRA